MSAFEAEELAERNTTRDLDHSSNAGLATLTREIMLIMVLLSKHPLIRNSEPIKWRSTSNYTCNRLPLISVIASLRRVAAQPTIDLNNTTNPNQKHNVLRTPPRRKPLLGPVNGSEPVPAVQ